MMYSPKELEGEVDHSFFDSDCDTGTTKPKKNEEGDGPEEKLSNQSQWKIEERGSMTMDNQDSEKRGVELLEKEMSELEFPSSLVARHDFECNKDVEPRKGASYQELETEEKDFAEQKDDKQDADDAYGKEDSDTSSRKSSPLPRSDTSDSSHGSLSDDSSSICSSSAEDNDAVFKTDDDDHHHDRHHCSKTAKKSIDKFHKWNHNHSSSCSSEERSPTTLENPSNTQSRLGSANQEQGAKTSESADSDDTVTDVTPLSSPESSPQLSFVPALPTSTELTLSDSLEIVDRKHVDANSDGEERSAVPHAGRQMDRLLLVSRPASTPVSSSSVRSSASRRHKNYSFSNDEVRRIESENRRLLRELSHSSTRPSSHSSHRTLPQPFRLYHSTLNRQREQQRIQRENLALLKRLESVKATPGMTRLEQLTDYQRQASYLGLPAPLVRPTSGKTSRKFSSTSPHRTTPETANPTRSMAARPAWF